MYIVLNVNPLFIKGLALHKITRPTYVYVYLCLFARLKGGRGVCLLVGGTPEVRACLYQLLSYVYFTSPRAAPCV